MLIQRISENQNILNSKSEWGQSTLPTITTEPGKQDIWQMESELRKEEAKEENYERKVRELRKERNKARLQKDHTTQSSERQRISSDEYISVRKVWGPPPLEAPGKSKIEEIKDNEERKKKPRLEKESEETAIEESKDDDKHHID